MPQDLARILDDTLSMLEEYKNKCRALESAATELRQTVKALRKEKEQAEDQAAQYQQEVTELKEVVCLLSSFL